MMAQDKVQLAAPLVVHELLHTGQNLVTDGVKSTFALIRREVIW